MSDGHQRFNGHQCPNLNLSQLSESQSDANSTHPFAKVGFYEGFTKISPAKLAFIYKD